MARACVLSGRDVLKILRAFGFQEYDQRGSHVKLRRVLADGRKQTLTVPKHDEIDRGYLGKFESRPEWGAKSHNPALNRFSPFL